MTELVGSLMLRIEALEVIVMEREEAEDQAELERLTAEATRLLSSVARNQGAAAEIDPLPPAPPAYTPLTPLSNDGGSSESSAPAAH